MSLLDLGVVCDIFAVGKRGQMKRKEKAEAQPRIIKGCGEAR